MKKLFAVIIALLLVATMPLMAFATENETIPSPTDVPVHEVIVTDPATGETKTETVEAGSTITLTVPTEGDKDFAGFTIDGEYEIISGAEYIVTNPDGSIKVEAGAVVVIAPKSDLKVTANYAETETTEPTEKEDEDGDSPQTGDDMLLLWIALAVVIGGAGCALAMKKLSKKEN